MSTVTATPVELVEALPRMLGYVPHNSLVIANMPTARSRPVEGSVSIMRSSAGCGRRRPPIIQYGASPPARAGIYQRASCCVVPTRQLPVSVIAVCMLRPRFPRQQRTGLGGHRPLVPPRTDGNLNPARERLPCR